jgi:long-subunit fatty acid transport protein
MHRALLCACLLTPVGATAQTQDFDFGSSPNPVGSGARALGIASAFIATADDATAASWNPGGLIALERPETSAVLSLKNRNEQFDGMGIARDDQIQRYTYADINYLSVAYPFKVGSRFFVAALNFQSLVDFDKEIRKTYFTAGTDLRAESDLVFNQRGSLKALAPAIAFQISPHVALGFTLTLWTDKLGYTNGWRQGRRVDRTVVLGSTTVLDELLIREQFDFNGVGANAGVLWDITPHWTLGAVLKTPVWGELTHTYRRFENDSEPVFDDLPEYKEAYRLPPSYGIGVAYRHSDSLTISADLYRTEWSLFKHRLTNPATGKRQSINPIDGQPYRKSKTSGITQVHVGAEYLIILPWTVVPLRGGFFYDPEPAASGTEHFLGMALGSGLSIGDVIIDAAYQLRAAIGAEPDVVLLAPTEGAATYDAQGGAVWQHLFYLSAIYHL